MTTFSDSIITTDQTDGLVCARNSASTGAITPVACMKFKGTANAASAYVVTVTNAAMAQACTLTVPDPGASSASFLLSAGANATGTFTALTATTATITTANITTGNVTSAVVTKFSAGATPVAFADAGSCTITPTAGASDTCTLTIQVKDGAGANIATSVPIEVYASSASNGLTIASAASTGFSVASGGMLLPGGGAVTQGIRAVTSVTGGIVLSLLDTGKATSYIVLIVNGQRKISAQLQAADYGA